MNPIIILVSIVNSWVLATGQDSFPDNFMFGVASSAYQVEGAWNEDGKGTNMWDHYIHDNVAKVSDGADADTAADSYHKFKEDVVLIASMNLKHYKFSLSWSRILPDGFNTTINKLGIDYYQNLIGELQKHNITPIVTLYHWDLPQPIQDLGGWTNESNIQYFVDYARVAFQFFDSVGIWITIHEPKQVCKGGYGEGKLAPFISSSGVLDYKCAYVVLKAHAAVYHLYKNEFSHLNGKISIALDGSWSEPLYNNKKEKKAAERRNQFEFGLYANPIFNKDWPQIVTQRVNLRDQKKHLNESRLPAFTPEEIAQIQNTADFLALNYYETLLVENDKEADPDAQGYEIDMRVKMDENSSWVEGSNGFTIVPWGIQNFLGWIKSTYSNPEVFITGNGVSDEGQTNDDLRISYISDHLTHVLKAIYEDNVNVTGYTYWSLLDSFEWTDGYRSHFGLFHVNMDSTKKTRTPKKSVETYRCIATNSRIPSERSTSSGTSSTTVSTFTSTPSTIKHTSSSITASTFTSTTMEPSTTSEDTQSPPTASSSSTTKHTSSSTTASTFTSTRSTIKHTSSPTTTTMKPSTTSEDPQSPPTASPQHSGSIGSDGNSEQFLLIICSLVFVLRFQD